MFTTPFLTCIIFSKKRKRVCYVTYFERVCTSGSATHHYFPRKRWIMGVECTKLEQQGRQGGSAQGCPPGSLHPRATLPQSGLGFMGSFSASPLFSSLLCWKVKVKLKTMEYWKQGENSLPGSVQSKILPAPLKFTS